MNEVTQYELFCVKLSSRRRCFENHPYCCMILHFILLVSKYQFYPCSYLIHMCTASSLELLVLKLSGNSHTSLYVNIGFISSGYILRNGIAE